MPQAQQGNVITSSAQINPGTIINSDLADDTLLNDKINSAAAIAMSKLALAITNSEVDAGAAIVDTKLAQILTAGKVGGAALTVLADIPSGAGVIPAVNIPSGGMGTLEGSNSTEGTGVGGGANQDVLTLSSLTIAATQWVRIMCLIRQASGTSSNFIFGLKINGTQIIPDTTVTSTSGFNGIIEIVIGPRVTSYVRSLRVNIRGNAITENNMFPDTDITTSEITDIILMGAGINGANSVGYDEAFVYSYNTS